jgi:hypothetical protein
LPSLSTLAKPNEDLAMLVCSCCRRQKNAPLTDRTTADRLRSFHETCAGK